MKTVWTKGLQGDAKKDIEQTFLRSILLRGRLRTILEEKRETVLKARTKEVSYDSPSWPYLQADAVGYTRAIDEIISLITDNSQ